MADMSDDDLIRMHVEGDPHAFDALFDRHFTAIYNFAWTMLHDAHAAEEVLQESFVAAHRAAPDYAPAGRFRAWLMKIARNRCLNRLESAWVSRVQTTDGPLQIIRPAAGDPSPPEQFDIDESTRLIREAIGMLPDRQREAIALYAFEQMRYREIAEVLGMPLNTVKTMIHRARATLARELASLRKEMRGEL